MNEQGIARALGWFSVGLGVAELLAPKPLGRSIGVGDRRATMRLLALRGITSGVGILSRKHSAAWLWSRVAGDAMDLTLLGTAMVLRKSERNRLAIAAAAVAGVAAVDTMCAWQASHDGGAQARKAVARKSPTHFTRVMTINRTPQDLYSFWRNAGNLPRVMTELISVTNLDATRSRWVVRGPGGKPIEWDSEIINDEPSRLIAWRALPGAQVEHAGTVRFEPATGDRGTVVRVNMQYMPPGGVFGARLAKLFGQAPEQQLGDGLRRLKQLMETGEIATTQGQPAGRPTSQSRRYDRGLKQLAET